MPIRIIEPHRAHPGNGRPPGAWANPGRYAGVRLSIMGWARVSVVDEEFGIHIREGAVRFSAALRETHNVYVLPTAEGATISSPNRLTKA